LFVIQIYYNKRNVRMFVAYRLKNYSTNFDESFRNYSSRYQESLRSSMNHVRKYIKWYIQSTTGGFPILVKLVHKARYTDADLPMS